MKRCGWIVLALVLICTCEANAQEPLPVVGGKAVLTIVPDTVPRVCPDCPECPPPVICPPPPAWECPEGWTCTPPPEPEADFVIASPTGDYQTGDTIPAGKYDRFFEDADGEWRDLGLSYNGSRVPGIDSVVFSDLNGRRNKEGLWPYGIWTERGNWTAAAGQTYTIIFDIHWTDAEIQTDTIEVIANPNDPPVPPDTLPPEPGDTPMFGYLVDDTLWIPENGALVGDTLPAGQYTIYLSARPGFDWTGVDSAQAGLDGPIRTTFPVPLCGLDGLCTLTADRHYFIPYEVHGPPDADGYTCIECRSASIIVPAEGQVYIDLDAPENLRIEHDSLFVEGETVMAPVVAWDPSPQDQQGISCDDPAWGDRAECRPVNDPDIAGDEVYPILYVSHVDTGEMVGMACDPFGNCVYDPEPFQNLHSWNIPIPTPDTIRACVQFQAWDCPECIGTGGQIHGYTNPDGNRVPGIPISETTCETLGVR